MNKPTRIAVIDHGDVVAKVRAAVGLNLPTPPVMKCLNCGQPFDIHYPVEHKNKWCPDRKSGDGFSIDKIWTPDTPANRIKLAPKNKVVSERCPDANCLRTDGQHTIRCKYSQPHRIIVQEFDWERRHTTHHQRRMVKKYYARRKHIEQSVSPVKQSRRCDMTIEEKRIRRKQLRRQTGIQYKSPAQSPAGGYLP